MQIGNGRIWSLREESTFALAEGGNLSIRARTRGDCANPTALENEAEFISNLVTDSTMEAEPLMAAHEVARISSKGH